MENIGYKLKSFEDAPIFRPYTKVKIQTDDEVLSAGMDGGRELTVTLPRGSPEMAALILSRIEGKQYQPYTAKGATIDPSLDIGDQISVGNVVSAIYAQSLRFGNSIVSNISAPADEEVDHEYPYTPQTERRVTRLGKQTKSTLKILSDQISAEVTARTEGYSDLSGKLSVQADLISAEVSARENSFSELSGKLNVQAGQISAEVTARENDVSTLSGIITAQADLISAKVSKAGGIESSFGWDLTDDSWTVKANNADVLRITSAGAYISGEVVASKGKIASWTIDNKGLEFGTLTQHGSNYVPSESYIRFVTSYSDEKPTIVGGSEAVSNWRMIIGPNFGVDRLGTLFASGANISGVLTATGGIIGGWKLETATIAVSPTASVTKQAIWAENRSATYKGKTASYRIYLTIDGIYISGRYDTSSESGVPIYEYVSWMELIWRLPT